MLPDVFYEQLAAAHETMDAVVECVRDVQSDLDRACATRTVALRPPVLTTSDEAQSSEGGEARYSDGGEAQSSGGGEAKSSDKDVASLVTMHAQLRAIEHTISECDEYLVRMLGQCSNVLDTGEEEDKNENKEDDVEEAREASQEVTRMMAHLGELRDIVSDARAVYNTIIRFVASGSFTVVRDEYDATASF